MKHRLLLLFLLAGCGGLGARTIDLRLSVKYFAAADDPWVTVAAGNAVQNANGVLARQSRGLRFTLSNVVRLNPSLPLPSTRYYTSPTNSVTLQLFSWGRWWEDNNPDTWQAEPPPPLVNYSKSPGGPYTSTYLPSEELIDLWRAAVRDHQAEFAYSNNACNIYLIWPEYGGGAGMFPGTFAADNIFYLSSLTDRSLILHEWGHWANLEHTFRSALSAGQKDALGDDDLADTPLDAWEVTLLPSPTIPPLVPDYQAYIDSVSQALYGRNYTDPTLGNTERDQVLVMGKIAALRWSLSSPWPVLDAGQAAEVRLVWRNLMSYHKGAAPEEQWLYTEDQLDKIADSMVAHASRASTFSGRWWFLGGPIKDNSAPWGSSQRPYSGLTSAIILNFSLAAGDVVIGRPGSYTSGGALRLDRACTLRAARGANLPNAQNGAFRIH